MRINKNYCFGNGVWIITKIILEFKQEAKRGWPLTTYKEQIIDEFWKRNTVPVTWLAEVFEDMDSEKKPSVTVQDGEVASDSVYADD